MRLFIVFLVVFNLLVFAWFYFQKIERESFASDRQIHDVSSVQQLVLKSEISPNVLSEMDVREKQKQHVDVKKEESIPRVMSEVIIADNKKCLLIGPYEEIITARSHANLLKKTSIIATMVEQVIELPSLYWVYVAPLADENTAIGVLEKFQTRNIDSYLVTTGEYKNAISLGVYSVEASADKVFNDRKKEGYPVKKILRTKEKKTIWLVVDEGDLNGFSTELFLALKEENLSLKKEEKNCKDVALLPSIL